METKSLVMLLVFFLIQANGNIIRSGNERFHEDENELKCDMEGDDFLKKREGPLGIIMPIGKLTVQALQSVLGDVLGIIDRNIVIGIGNGTPYKWKAIGVYFRSGTSDEVLPARIKPKEAVIYSARKTSGLFAYSGVVGMLCYYISDQDKSLCILFSVPFDYDFYSNWWDVRMFPNLVSPSKEMYEKMYYDGPYSGNDHYYEKNLGYGFVMVSGIMNSAGKARLLVKIAMK